MTLALAVNIALTLAAATLACTAVLFLCSLAGRRWRGPGGGEGPPADEGGGGGGRPPDPPPPCGRGPGAQLSRPGHATWPGRLR